MISNKSLRLAAALREVLNHSDTTGNEDVLAFACVMYSQAVRSAAEGIYSSRGAALTTIIDAIVSAWAELDREGKALSDSVADELISRHVGKSRT
jgi:hypothetical protein